ncbi:hypothetical protein [Thalassomonas sp. RHCl1]|uniref:DUF7151 family protein n=1 Tax=Thalassomonas sp. RHCl1 TaxID=2995320 RepID=UPI00248CB079|nr:hypothetical protein [Thalassomonas sp. RHCl1]
MKQTKLLKRSKINNNIDTSIRFKKLSLTTLITLALTACGSDIDQASSDQVNSWSRSPVPETAGDNCPFGGEKVESGADTNKDGVLQDSEINQVDYLCNDSASTSTYVNDMSDLSDNFWRSFNLATEDNSTAGTDDAIYRFQGDLFRFKRSDNTAEYLDYLIPGAIENAVVSAYYWEGDSPEVAPFKMFASKVGANNPDDWIELTVTQEKVGDYTQRASDEDQNDEENDNWIKVDFTAADIKNQAGEDYDFIRVQFPVVASGQAWHPQLGNLEVAYSSDTGLAADNNAAPEPAQDPSTIVIPVTQTDGLDNFNQVFSHSDSLFFDSSDGDGESRFNGDTSRLKRGTNTEEYVQYQVYGEVKTIEVVGYYHAFDESEPFTILVSKTGGNDEAEWTELTTTHIQAEGDAVEDWTTHTYTATTSEEQADFDFVRVVFPIIADDSKSWHPQLGDVNITYHQDYSLDSDNVSRDLSGVEIAGGQAPLALEQSIKDTMLANGISTQFDWYITRGEGSNGIGDSNKLYQDDSGQEFRFVSYNTPNLVMTEDPIWDITPVFEQEDGIKTIKDMGGKVTRIYTMGIYDASSPDKVKHISWDENGALVFNEDIFVAMDNLLAIANKHGVRVQIPFIDRSLWWGGIAHFAQQYGKSSPEFFTDRTTIDAFKEVISYVLNRVNTVTGIAYKDDPAVFAWETGNELRSDDLAAIESWTSEIAAHIKSIDSKHLVMDGREARSTRSSGEYEMRMSNSAMFDSNIDVLSNHYYGDNFSARIMQDLDTISGVKPFVVGEIGFGDLEMADAIDTVINEGSTGILLWSLRTHDINGGFKDHDDGAAHSYHWPGFADNFVYNEVKIMENAWDKAYEIDGEMRPALPAPAKAPVMLASPSTLDIRWQGVTSARYYDIQRSDNGTDGWTLVGDDIEIGATTASNYILADRTDSFGTVHPGVKHQILFQDATAVANETYYYRAKAINESGESDWSNVIGTSAQLIENGIVEDSLSSLTSATALSDVSVLFVDSGNTEFFENDDAGRIKRGGTGEEWLMYSFGGDINTFWLTTYFWRSAPETDVADFKVQLSTDGSSWDDFTPESSSVAQRGDWEQIDLVGRGITGGYQHLRVVFPVAAAADSSWAQQLGNVKIGVGTGVISDLPNPPGVDGLVVDNFDAYPDDASIKANWVDQAWTTITVDNSGDSQQMQVQYDVGANGYSGVLRTFATPQDWTSGNAIQFSLKHQNAGNVFVVQIDEDQAQFKPDGGVDSWEWATVLDDSNIDGVITIKFEDFLPNHNFPANQVPDATVFDRDAIRKLGFWQNQGYTPFGQSPLQPLNNSTGENLLIDNVTIVTVP